MLQFTWLRASEAILFHDRNYVKIILLCWHYIYYCINEYLCIDIKFVFTFKDFITSVWCSSLIHANINIWSHIFFWLSSFRRRQINVDNLINSYIQMFSYKYKYVIYGSICILFNHYPYFTDLIRSWLSDLRFAIMVT